MTLPCTFPVSGRTQSCWCGFSPATRLKLNSRFRREVPQQGSLYAIIDQKAWVNPAESDWIFLNVRQEPVSRNYFDV